MPNHIHNRVTMLGDSEEIEACKKAIGGDSNEGWEVIDFNKILQRPPELEGDFYCHVEDAAEYALQLPKSHKAFHEMQKPHWFNDEEFSQFLKMLANYKKYGALNWYKWSIDNWGTKWNAYDCTAKYQTGKPNEIQFDTAWNSPRKLIKKLSELFPHICFQVIFCCEGADHAGEYSYQNGKWLTDENYPYQHERTMEIFRELRPEDAAEYILVNGAWHHKDSL